MQPTYGKIGYYAGDDGTVTVAAGERLLSIYAVGDTGDGTLTIAGGDSIPLKAGVPFWDKIGSGTIERTGPIDLVFTGTVSYYVKVLRPLSP